MSRPDDATGTTAAAADPESAAPSRPLADLVDDSAVWAIIEGAPDGTVVCDHEGQLVLLNEQAEQMFGYVRAELLGQPVERLLPDGLAKSHVRARSDYIAHPMRRAMGKGLELRARHRSGAEFPVEIALSPVRVGDQLLVVASVRDVTERHRHEQERARAQHRLRRVVETAMVGLWCIGRDRTVTLAVGPDSGRLGPVDSLVGLPVAHVLAPYPEILEAVEVGFGRRRVEKAIEFRDERHMRVSVEPLLGPAPADDPGGAEVEEVVVVLVEITELVAAQRDSEAAKIHAAETSALMDERDRMARELHDTVIQRLFASGLSLQAVAATVPDIASGRIQEAIDSIDAAIRELRMAIFAMSGAQKHVADTGVQRAIRQIAEEAGRLLPDRPSVSFQGPVDSAVSDAMRHDLIAVTREALSNIVRHARAKAVRVDLEVGDGNVMLTIVDDGVGMPLKLDTGGRGLTNLRERAERHGGSCELGSTPGGGTTIRWIAPSRGIAAEGGA